MGKKIFRNALFLLWMVSVISLIPVFPSHSEDTEKPVPLWKKAEIFQQDMEERFLLNGQALCKLTLPKDGKGLSYNMPDNAYMTGIYVGTLSMKYLITKDEKDKEKLIQSIKGLNHLCRVSGEPGLLARAAIPADSPWEDNGIWRLSPDKKYKWRGDVSSDQVDGVMFGFSWAYDTIPDEDIRKEIAKDVTDIVEHILKNDLRIIDVDGKPTVWGRYFPQYVKLEPLNALLWLQTLKVAHQVSGNNKYAELYKKYAIEMKYAEMAIHSRRNLDPTRKGFVNHSDDFLFFLGIEPLFRLEQDPQIREYYIQSFQHAWEGTPPYPGLKPEANPLYSFLAAKYLNDSSEIENAINTLMWFPFSIKWNQDTLKKYEQQHGIKLSWKVQSPEPEKGKPLPIDRRDNTWSAWVQDPYLYHGDPMEDSPVEYNGHDFLLGYWLGRYYSFIPPDK